MLRKTRRRRLRLVHRVSKRKPGNEMMALPPKTWEFSPLQPGTKGGKTCLLSSNKLPIEFSLGGPTSTPFGASNFDDDNNPRQNLDLTLSDDDVANFQAVDALLLAWALQNKDTLFKSGTSPEKIQESYRSILRQKDGYKPLLRTKINLERVKLWDEANNKIGVPDDKFRRADLWVKLRVGNVWFVPAGSWGLTLECQHVKVRERADECPFNEFPETD